MSLVSELKNPHSPVTQYLRFVGSMVADAGKGPMAESFKRFLGLDDLPRVVAVEPAVGANPAMVGTAFDYRLRYHLAPCESRHFVAYGGAHRFVLRVAGAYGIEEIAEGAEPDIRPRLERFFTHLDSLAEKLSPAGQYLDDDSERLLDTYCVVLAQLESVYRTAGGWTPELPPDVKRTTAGPKSEPLLALAPESVIEDVMNLSRSAGTIFNPLIEAVTSESAPYYANPTFLGSTDINGADADFIIGDTLFELKTVKKLDAAAVRDALLQLIGYCLLDYDDRHEVRKVAVYFPRQEWVSGWPLWTLVFPPADVILRTVNEKEPTEEEIAERLAKLRVLMRRVVKGDAIDYEAEFS